MCVFVVMCVECMCCIGEWEGERLDLLFRRAPAYISEYIQCVHERTIGTFSIILKEHLDLGLSVLRLLIAGSVGGTKEK